MDQVVAGGPLERRAAVAALLQNRGDLLVVTGLGSPAYDVMAAGDHEHNYYLWAAMGSATMLGLGLATAQPGRPVLVVTGDGEAMMGLGALATIAVHKPKNLAIAILDNGHFGETGMQQSHAGRGIELHRVAASMGFRHSECITRMEQIDALRESLPLRSELRLASIKIRADNPPRVLPPRDGVHIKNRFRAALGYRPI